jgi:hypothetical protein
MFIQCMIYRVICKTTFNYMYYRNLPKVFKTDNFIVEKVPYTKIIASKILSN